MVAPALLIGGGMAGAGLLGGLLNQQNDDMMKQYMDRALAELSGISAPTQDELTYQLNQLVQAGQITPEQANAILIEQSAYSNIPESGVGRDAQLAALEQLRSITEQGGMTAQDRARLAQIQQEIGTAQRGAREAILQNAAQRGIAGSGLELAAQLGSQQAAAQQASMQGMETEAQAEARALEAIRNMGTLGGQVSSQDLQRQLAIAQAQDAIARFNAQNRQNVEMTNVAARNAAQAQNLAERQRIMDTNVQLQNQQAAQRAAAAQQEYANRMQMAQARAGILGTAGQAAQQQQQQQQQFWGNLLGTGGLILGNYAKPATTAATTEQPGKKYVQQPYYAYGGPAA